MVHNDVSWMISNWASTMNKLRHACVTKYSTSVQLAALWSGREREMNLGECDAQPHVWMNNWLRIEISGRRNGIGTSHFSFLPFRTEKADACHWWHRRNSLLGRTRKGGHLSYWTRTSSQHDWCTDDICRDFLWCTNQRNSPHMDDLHCREYNWSLDHR